MREHFGSRKAKQMKQEVFGLVKKEREQEKELLRCSIKQLLKEEI